MTLSNLPTEILLQITDCLDPQSVFNFALSCQSHHCRFKSLLEHHKQLFKRYKYINTEIGRSSTDNTELHLIWSILKEVIRDPRKGSYIQELNLPSSRRYHYNNEGYGDNDLPPAPSEEDRNIFRDAAHALGDLYPPRSNTSDVTMTGLEIEHRWPDFMTYLEGRIASGFDDAIIAILIHHAPNLQVIRITDSETDALQTMLRWIAMTYRDPMRAPKMPLQHLKYASVAHYDSEMSCDPDWACWFLSIPSLQGFAASSIGDEISPVSAEAYTAGGVFQNSNVSELYFSYCRFEAESFATILGGLPNLRKLYYIDGGAIISESHRFEPKKVIRAIAENLGDCLEELVLGQDDLDFDDDEDDENEDIEDGSHDLILQKFKRLKILECDWHMLLPDEVMAEIHMASGEAGDEGTVRSPPKIELPETLEELRISGRPEYIGFEEARDLFTSKNIVNPAGTSIRKEKRPAPGYAIYWEEPHGWSASSKCQTHSLHHLLAGHGY